MKHLLTLISIAFFVSSINAQDYKFGKVSKEELIENIHPVDSSANAALLYRKVKSYVGYNYMDGKLEQTRYILERVKIYNKNGFDWATKRTLLYKGKDVKNERIRDLKGYTYNLVNNKVVKTKLKKDGIFEEQINDAISQHIFTMPNIEDGCIIEYEYTISSPYTSVDDILLQYEIPINRLEVTFSYDKYFTYSSLLNTLSSYSPKINFKSRDGVNTVKQYNDIVQQSNYVINEVIIKENNVPSLIKEAYSGNLNNYRQKLSLELTQIKNGNGIVEKLISNTWVKVSQSIYESSAFGKQLEKTKFFKDDLALVVNDTHNAFEKTAIASNLIKSKVKWNGNYGMYSRKGIKKAYEEGEGNVGDINLLLISMLKSIGVNANPVLVSTKNHGIPLYPTRDGFNYVICMVEDNGSYVLVDATEPFAPLNVLPDRVLNWQGRVIKEDRTSGWISLMPSKQSQYSTSLNVKLEDDFSISGKVRQMITSNLALRYRKTYSGLSEADKIKSLEADKGDFEVSNLQIEHKDNGNLSLAYDYNLNDAIDDIGEKLYFSPLLFMVEKENPFKLNERKYPIDFSMPIKEKYKVNIMLPNGYAIASIPQSEVIQFKDGDVKYSFILKQNGNFIQLSTEFDLKTPIIDPEDYKVFKEFYGKIVEKQAEQIILTKL
ncbi:MAG: DUF3857 domain-containing protein [Winogradskyella sp.]|uniref:DUF3857 domain-containing protein n=1 Tax=Winogradskyella sp. TaxID=1883156 RepID=UPI000F3E6AAA|nr:DUF3857 domain-containing protein [Winogradskyella sp.]RNC84179.1 MAG: DUF3857 domain-containing protein [Winogradskyella sp.]